MLREIDIATNERLKEILRDREDVLDTLIDVRHADDYTLAIYKRFRQRYDQLDQLGKDVWYICSVYSMEECARLYQCNVRTVKRYYEKVKEYLYGT
jgi:hypothetical protein